jgi:hypothetical protein
MKPVEDCRENVMLFQEGKWRLYDEPEIFAIRGEIFKSQDETK